MAEDNKSRTRPRLSHEAAKKLNAELEANDTLLREKRNMLQRQLETYEIELHNARIKEKMRLAAAGSGGSQTLSVGFRRIASRLKNDIAALETQLIALDKTLDLAVQVQHQQDIMRTQFIAAKHVKLLKEKFSNESGWYGAQLLNGNGIDSIAEIEDDIVEAGDTRAAVNDMFERISRANETAFKEMQANTGLSEDTAEEDEQLMRDLDLINIDDRRAPAPTVVALETAEELDNLPDVTRLPRVNAPAAAATSSPKLLASEFMM